MNAKPHITLPVLLLGGFLTSMAWSAPAEDRFPIAISEIEAKAKSHFERIDADESGGVSLAEFEASKSHHPRAGRQGAEGHGKRDGKRDGQRRKHEGVRAHPRQQQMRAAVQDELFMLMDTDGDGVLSAAEFKADNSNQLRRDARKRAAFKHLDKNNDGQLTQDEMPGRLAHLRAADADDDGMVTRDEFRAQRRALHKAHKGSQQAG
jgi:Ca2+-binding EF-hand superfamily protein